MIKEENSKNMQQHSEEIQGKQMEENQAALVSLPCLNVKTSVLIVLGRCNQSMRSFLTALSFRKALGSSREGVDNLALIKLQSFALLLCLAVLIAVWASTEDERTAAPLSCCLQGEAQCKSRTCCSGCGWWWKQRHSWWEVTAGNTKEKAVRVWKQQVGTGIRKLQ